MASMTVEAVSVLGLEEDSNVTAPVKASNVVLVSEI